MGVAGGAPSKQGWGWGWRPGSAWFCLRLGAGLEPGGPACTDPHRAHTVPPQQQRGLFLLGMVWNFSSSTQATAGWELGVESSFFTVRKRRRNELGEWGPLARKHSQSQVPGGPGFDRGG